MNKKKYAYAPIEIFIPLILNNDFDNVFGSSSMQYDEKYILHLMMVKSVVSTF
jgi:hypothetical protein